MAARALCSSPPENSIHTLPAPFPSPPGAVAPRFLGPASCVFVSPGPSLQALLPSPPSQLLPDSPHVPQTYLCALLCPPPLPAFVLASFWSFMALWDPPWREGQGKARADQGGDPHRAQGASEWAGAASQGRAWLWLLQPRASVAPASTHTWKHPGRPPLQLQGHVCFSQQHRCPSVCFPPCSCLGGTFHESCLWNPCWEPWEPGRHKLLKYTLRSRGRR